MGAMERRAVEVRFEQSRGVDWTGEERMGSGKESRGEDGEWRRVGGRAVERGAVEME